VLSSWFLRDKYKEFPVAWWNLYISEPHPELYSQQDRYSESYRDRRFRARAFRNVLDSIMNDPGWGWTTLVSNNLPVETWKNETFSFYPVTHFPDDVRQVVSDTSIAFHVIDPNGKLIYYDAYKNAAGTDAVLAQIFGKEPGIPTGGMENIAEWMGWNGREKPAN